MITSINYFEEKIIPELDEIQTNFFKDPKKFSDYVLSVTEQVHKLGIMILKETLEEADKLLRESQVRKRHWHVEHRHNKSLITHLGTVEFQKTLFVNKETGKSKYLLDEVFGFKPHQRITEDAIAGVLKECVQTSYEKGGEAVSLMDTVKKQTVKNIVHNLEFPEEVVVPEEKKVVDYLYIEADEDHVSLQFREKKGDLVKNKYGRKNNCLLAKLVYVHEGIKPESIINKGTENERNSKRNALINPHFFGSIANDKDNDTFWDEIYQWIDAHYDLKKVKKIYLNSDGGRWITAGAEKIAGLIHVLDEFHLEKYMLKLTGHMKDSTDDARKEIYDAIKADDREEFIKIAERLKAVLPADRNQEKFENNKTYILNNWEAARLRIEKSEGIVGSSTEGHVFHELSSRMSTKPMGWSIHGATNMAKLRIYYMNGGDMYELALMQKMMLPKAAGMEECYPSVHEMFRAEIKTQKTNGKYFESLRCSISDTMKNRDFMKGILGGHIWNI